MQFQGVAHKKQVSQTVAFSGKLQAKMLSLLHVSSFLFPRSTGALINFISICKFAIITIISCEYLTIPNADALDSDSDCESRLQLQVSSLAASLPRLAQNAFKECVEVIMRFSIQWNVKRRIRMRLRTERCQFWISHNVQKSLHEYFIQFTLGPALLHFLLPLDWPGLAWSEGAAN